jgi:Fe-Mn family superoxide dismutase
MKKREFLKTGSVLAIGSLVAPMVSSCKDAATSNRITDVAAISTLASPFVLPELPYAPEALEPYIDTQTMNIHHGKHHAGYVNNLNKALEGHEWSVADLKTILHSLESKPEHIAIRNNGGGHFNHSLFWKVMTPGGGQVPTGRLAEAINATFTSFEGFKEVFSKAAATRFGSGWAWLSVSPEGKLSVSSTPNQDNPLMKNIAEAPGTPILGIDVWEHAYYLKYQNRRAEYIDGFFNLINWEAVAANLDGVQD